MNNNMYFTADLVYNRVASIFKKKIKEVTLGNFIEWCADCEINWIGSFEQFMQCNNHKVIVSKNRALLPCNIYTLKDVKDGNTRVFDYRNNGTYLFFDKQNYADGKELQINYWGIPIDNKTKMPLLLKGHETACEKFCIVKMHEEDFSEGKINMNIWQSMTSTADDAIDSARSSMRHVTNDDKVKMLAAMQDMIKNPGYLSFQNVDYD